MNAQIKQMKELLDDSKAKLKDLQGKGKEVADKVRSRVEETATIGTQAVSGAIKDAIDNKSLKDLLDQWGAVKVPDLVEHLKKPEMTRQIESFRIEILSFLRLPGVEEIDLLNARIEDLGNQIAELKATHKADMKKLSQKAAPKPNNSGTAK